MDITESADKLLFGSDAPISNQESYISVASKLLPEEIFFENAKRVFKL